MTRLGLLVALALLAGCSSHQQMLPGTRLIYDSGNDKTRIWTWCDRGNRVYMEAAGIKTIIPNGCPDGLP